MKMRAQVVAEEEPPEKVKTTGVRGSAKRTPDFALA
jgi:hypothetical protein